MTERAPLHSDEEQLVAYLDGELSREERAALEQRLARDEHFRLRLASLQRSWDALDELPRVVSDPKFTATTMSMVAVRCAAETRPVAPGRSWWGSTWWRTAAIAVTTAGIAFAGVGTLRSRRYRAELQDLPVAQNLELYRQAEDFEFLQALARENLFDGSMEPRVERRRRP